MRARDRLRPLLARCAGVLGMLLIAQVACRAEKPEVCPGATAEQVTIIREVIYKGAKHLKDQELEFLTGVHKDMPLDTGCNQRACQAIVRKLQEDGRPFATCELISGNKPGDSRVIFNINEGPRLGVRSIAFTGNKWGMSAQLMTLIQSKPNNGIFLGKYLPELVEADMAKIDQYYRCFGFLHVVVTREIQFAPDGEDLDIVFHIDEGMRCTFKSLPELQWKNLGKSGKPAVPREQLDQLTGIKPGAYYSQSVVDADISKLTDYYGYTGRVVKVEAMTVFDKHEPGVVTVKYEIEEHPQGRVGSIWVTGQEHKEPPAVPQK